MSAAPLPPSRRLAAARLGLVLALALVADPRDAEAQPAPPKTPESLPARGAQITLEKHLVELSVGFRDAVDAAIEKKLTSGLPTVITMRAYLFPSAGGDPIALTAKSCRIVYDLWDEVFRIQLTQPGGQSNPVAVNVEGVARICCEARRLPLVERSLLRDDGRYFVAALVEVNPVSAEMLERIKKWVTRPSGSSAIGPGDSLFGSFVGLFVTRAGDADKKIAFRTPTFAPPSPPPPPPPPQPPP
ncbi:MAG: hypothetical protein U0359_24455 [Byssovorax sp.]